MIKARFEKFRQNLMDAHVPGALITSTPNFQYLMGFHPESPAMLYVPATDKNITPTIFTNPLEEEIVKIHIPFSELDLAVVFKTPDAKAVRAFGEKKYHSVIHHDKPVLMPDYLLESLLQKDVATKLSDLLKEESETFPHDIPGVNLPSVIQTALTKYQIIPATWEGQDVFVSRLPTTTMLAEFFNIHDISVVGIEEGSLPIGQYNEFNKKYIQITHKSLDGKDIGELLSKQRIIKDALEIELLKKAAAIGDIGFAAAAEAIHELATENEVRAKAEYAMIRAGSSKPSFETIVVSGKNSAFPHGHASEKQIEKGDLVTVDIGATFQGYCSDMTRTILAAHEEPPEALKILRTVNQAHKIGIDAVKPGIKWGDPDVAVRKFFEEKEVLQYYLHSLGHGVGVEVHEMPGISHRLLGPTQILKPGMVLTIEPGLYIPGVGGARTEDTVVVTEDGCEAFNKTPYLHYED
jgi:Xaa-Pro aminopeptidase